VGRCRGAPAPRHADGGNAMDHGRSGARRRGHGERGAVLVEAVLILPILLALTFGAIEFGFGFSRRAAVESLARTGARTAAANSGAADVGSSADGMSLAARDAVNAALGTGSLPTMNTLYVYKDGFGPGAGGACGTYCSQFTFDTSTKQFGNPSGGSGWPKANRNYCPPNADKVVVEIRSTHNFITGLFGASIGFVSKATMQLEPQASCAG